MNSFDVTSRNTTRGHFFTRLQMALCALFLMTAPAYAYVDPGMASIALQAFIGALAAGGLFFRTKIALFFDWVRGRRRPDSSDTATSNELSDRGDTR